MLFDNSNRSLLLNTSLAEDIITLAIGTSAEKQLIGLWSIVRDAVSG